VLKLELCGGSNHRLRHWLMQFILFI